MLVTAAVRSAVVSPRVCALLVPNRRLRKYETAFRDPVVNVMVDANAAVEAASKSFANPGVGHISRLTRRTRQTILRVNDTRLNVKEDLIPLGKRTREDRYGEFI